tara:strand:+ start:451 stop:1059 length:609 start_codon:yes stop_codon:yes gene_type:complete
MSEPKQLIIAENWEYMQVIPDTNDPTGVATALASVTPFPIVITPNTDCGLTTAQIAAKDVPDGVKFEIIDADKLEEYVTVGIGSTAMLLSGAIDNYDFDTRECTYNLDRVKKMAHRKRRNRRYCEFAPKDVIVAKAIPGTIDPAEEHRVQTRSKYATMQTEIDACSTVDEVYAILQKYPALEKPIEADSSGFDRTEVGPNIS